MLGSQVDRGLPKRGEGRRRLGPHLLLVGTLLAVVASACSSVDASAHAARSTTTAAGSASSGKAPNSKQVGRQPDGSVITSTGQVLTPAGRQVEFSGRPVAVALRPDGATATFLSGTALQGGSYPLLTVVDVATAKVVQQFSPPSPTPASFAGLAYSSDGSRLYASALSGVVDASVAADGTLHFERLLADGMHPTGLAVSGDDRTLYVALNERNTLAIVDLATGALATEVPVGNAPHGVLLAGDRAYVTNQGGRRAEPGDFTNDSAGTPIVADRERGAASTGTVSVVDVTSRTVAATVDVELQPTALALHGKELFVANTNSDSVSVIDTATDRRLTTFAVKPFPGARGGSAPNGLAFLDKKRIAVSLGRDNALAVYEWRSPREPVRFRGLIPTASYPADLAVDPARKTLLVANAVGVGALGPEGPAFDASVFAGLFPSGPKTGHKVQAFLGSASLVKFPGDRQLAEGTRRVTRNNGWNRLQRARRRKKVAPKPVPDRLGEPSRIKHVVYIIKENRTYDQVLGDDPRGNGAPSLVEFGAEVTPNQHALATRWSLFDNFYSAGAVSADGHQWVTQADDPDYVEKMYNQFPAGRSYPSEGGDALAYLKTGFLWENAEHHDRSVRVYGEYAGKANPTRSDVPSLDRVLSREYPMFDLSVSDQRRADIFLQDLAGFERSGTMPDLVIMSLPADHTLGTAPGYPTPTTQVSDNDLAVGRVVEGLSKSRFWKSLAVFVLEDDAQAAVDHVDGYRTTAFLASPYAARDAVNHTFYNQVNVIRTIEQILGLPPMNQMDLAAAPMRDAFTDRPDVAPFAAIRPAVIPASNPQPASLNGPAREWAEASAALDFSVPDVEANRPLLNRVIWYATKGYDTPYPGDGRVLRPGEVPSAEEAGEER